MNAEKFLNFIVFLPNSFIRISPAFPGQVYAPFCRFL